MISRRALLAAAPAILLLSAGQSRPPAIRVNRSPTCGCCGGWIQHMRQAGFEVTENVTRDLDAVAQRLGVPEAMRACHTAEAGGYFIEGHVPAADVRRLLAERPNAAGIAVPGMPIGSPGMEVGNRRQPYQTLLVARGGGTSVFAQH